MSLANTLWLQQLEAAAESEDRKVEVDRTVIQHALKELRRLAVREERLWELERRELRREESRRINGGWSP